MIVIIRVKERDVPKVLLMNWGEQILTWWSSGLQLYVHATQAHMHRGISSLSLVTFFCQKTFQCEACTPIISRPIQALREWETSSPSYAHAANKQPAKSCLSTYVENTAVPALEMWNLCYYIHHSTGNAQTYSKHCNGLRQVDLQEEDDDAYTAQTTSVLKLPPC